MTPIIEISGLSKSYVISHQPEAAYDSLRDDIVNLLRRPFQPHITQGASRETVWALDDVSFDVQQGEIVGIIGRNGSGKSTILKILSRITEPTKGRAVLRGRTSSLLEVGTGFNPELTGRENIYLNGAILGMRKREIARKLDEIIDFSEVEKYIDTPVKFYSSGMYVRLAFAVAAHLEPDILIVDEVLAVGDARFQKKSLSKMHSVASEGRTVLFVSHNMNSIQRLCNRALLLEDGKVRASSNDVRSIVSEYLLVEGTTPGALEWRSSAPANNPYFRPTRFALTDRSGSTIERSVRNDSEFWVHIEGDILKSDPDLTIGYAIYAEDGECLYWSYPTDTVSSRQAFHREGPTTLRALVPKHLLNESTYRLELIASLHFRSWLYQPEESAPSISMTIQGGLSSSPYWLTNRPGILAPILEWDVK